jgi:hypothetical protein
LVLSERRALPFLVTENRLRVTIQGPDNNSLDASGISGLVIDNLAVAQLLPAGNSTVMLLN